MVDVNPSAAAPGTASSQPTLEFLDPNSSHRFQKPSKRINQGQDVNTFLTSKAYRDIGLFVLQLNRALCPRKKPSLQGGSGRETVQTFPLTSLGPSSELPAPIRSIQELLRKAGSLIEDAPPDPGPRRFGNVAFRTWFSLLEERCPDLLRDCIPASVLSFGSSSQGGDGNGNDDGVLSELTAYFLGSFGSAQRLDYGTGHELSFLAFLGCLWKLQFFGPSSASPAEREETTRQVALALLEPYLEVVRRLILTYTLEPAGSHGVWGLDDHSFLPYIFGSAQLTRAVGDGEPMPTEGSVRGAPKTGDVVKADVVRDLRGENMYFSAIGFINDVKKGPFWEHSPILFDVSGIRDGWGKINKGMIKMYNAEVLSKFPVVQHFPFGALFSWDQDPDAVAPTQSVHMANQPHVAVSAPAATAAPPPPSATSMPTPPTGGPSGMPPTAAPWATTATRAPPTLQGQRRPPAPTARPGSGPGPRSGVIGSGHVAGDGTSGRGDKGSDSTHGQVTMTKAPWAQ